MIQISQFAAADALKISMFKAIFAAKAEKPNLWAQIRSYPSSGRFCFNLNQMSDELPVIKSIFNQIYQAALWFGHYDFKSIPKNLVSQIDNLTYNMLQVNGKAKILIRSILNNPRTGLTGTPQGHSKFDQIEILTLQC